MENQPHQMHHFMVWMHRVNSTTQDSNGNTITGIVGTISRVGNTLSIGAIAVVVATTKAQVTALTASVAVL